MLRPVVITFTLIIAIVFIFYPSPVYSQYNFSESTAWVKEHLGELGGRAILMVWKDGRLVLNDSQNDLSKRQRIAGKMLARRQGKDAAEVLADFTSSSRERIASSSKWLTAALVMTYVDEGKIKLEDTIGKYLPIMTQHNKGGIKVWQCLSHLTGIQTAGLQESLEDFKKANSMSESIEAIALLPVEGKPGFTFHYGNTGLQIAAAICEKVGEDNFENLFHNRIAVPCNMINTDFGKTNIPLAAGGAWSSAEDYMNFLVMLLEHGKFNGKQVLSRASIEEMQKNRIAQATIAYSPPEAAAMAGYGFGEWVNVEESGTSNVISSPGLFGSFPWIDKRRRYAAFLLVFNLKNKDRQKLYAALKQTVDTAIDAVESKR